MRAEAAHQREEAQRQKEREETAKREAEEASPADVHVDTAPPPAEQDGKGLTSKQARVQAAMRDTKLTPQVSR